MKFLDVIRGEIANATSVKRALGQQEMTTTVEPEEEVYIEVELLNISVDNGKYSLIVSQIAPYIGRLKVRETISGNILISSRVDLMWENRGNATDLEKERWQREAIQVIDNYEWMMDGNPY